MSSNLMSEDLKSMSTFDLAYKLATQQFDEKQRMDALLIIQQRDLLITQEKEIKSKEDLAINNIKYNVKKVLKPPLKGSKTEKIYNLFIENKTPAEVYKILTDNKIVVYYPEIYRVQRDYFPDRVKKNKK